MSKVVPIRKNVDPPKDANLDILVCCQDCGHQEVVQPAVVLPKHDGHFRCVFGSRADFCNKCDSGNISIKSAPGSSVTVNPKEAL